MSKLRESKVLARPDRPCLIFLVLRRVTERDGRILRSSWFGLLASLTRIGRVPRPPNNGQQMTCRFRSCSFRSLQAARVGPGLVSGQAEQRSLSQLNMVIELRIAYTTYRVQEEASLGTFSFWSLIGADIGGPWSPKSRDFPSFPLLLLTTASLLYRQIQFRGRHPSRHSAHD